MTDPSTQSSPTGEAAPDLAARQPAPTTAVGTVALPVQQRLDEILARLDELSGRFASKLQYDEAKQQQIDVLYGEIRQAREGLFLQILRQIFLSLIALHDIISQGYEVAVRETGGEGSATARNILSYRAEIEEILARSGVNHYQSAQGTPFDRERHQVRGTQPTDHAALDKTIAQSQRPGFDYQGKVLRPEWVLAYQYAAAR